LSPLCEDFTKSGSGSYKSGFEERRETLKRHRDNPLAPIELPRAEILGAAQGKSCELSEVIKGLDNKARVTRRKSCCFRTFHITELGKLPEPPLTRKFL